MDKEWLYWIDGDDPEDARSISLSKYYDPEQVAEEVSREIMDDSAGEAFLPHHECDIYVKDATTGSVYKVNVKVEYEPSFYASSPAEMVNIEDI